MPHEGVTNRLVAKAAVDHPHLRPALTSAIWGPAAATKHEPTCTLIASGTGADWRTVCECGEPERVCEHKPWWNSVPQDCWIDADPNSSSGNEIEQAIDLGIITPTDRFAMPSRAHWIPHARRDDCVLCMGDSHGSMRLVLPQVVVYALRTPRHECLLLTDYASADECWRKYGPPRWDELISISPTAVPVRSSLEVIKVLANAAQHWPNETVAPLRQFACRLWWRMPWPTWDQAGVLERAFVAAATTCHNEHQAA